MTHRLYMAIHCNFIEEYQLCNYTVSALVFLAMALLHTFGFSLYLAIVHSQLLEGQSSNFQ